MRSRRRAAGQEPEDHRAAGAGGPGGGPLGAGGLRRHAPTRSTRNLEMEFQRNRERYQFLKWGMQAFDTFKVVPPGIGIVHQVNLEYLAKGVLEKRRRLLPRHARRHRLAHDDDQRPRHRRLGRRRHRSRGGHARPAGLFPHAGRRRRAPDRRAARRRHRDRPRADRHADAAQGQGRRQVRRVLRPGRGGAAGGGPRDHRQHGARIRRDDGLLPDRRARCVQLPARHRPQRGAGRRVRELLQGAGPVRASRRRARCDYSQVLELDLGDVEPERGRPEAPAGPHRTAEAEGARFVDAVQQAGHGERLRQDAARTRARAFPVVSADGAITAGGGSQEPVRRRRPRRRTPIRSTETGDGEQPPDARPRRRRRRRTRADVEIRPRRRADRRHHQLHEHLQPERDARRRAAREEGGRARPAPSTRSSRPRSRRARAWSAIT